MLPATLVEAVLLRPGLPQETVVAHLNIIQDCLNLAATCKAAYQASRGWFVSKRISVELVPAHDVNPPYTADFPSLHFLWAGSPQFECLLAWLDRFPTSVHFNVTDEDVLHTSMARLPSAATLSLSTFLPWREHTLPVSSISHLTALTELILREISLHGSLEGLWQLTRLQQLELELDNAQLSGSWEGMTRLSQLRDLHLSGLCAPLPALPQLTNLELEPAAPGSAADSAEGLDSLDFLSQLSQLQRFDMHGCDLDDLSTALPHLTSLVSLEQPSPGSADSWWALSHLQCLRFLKLADFDLPELPPAVSTLSGLQLLSLEGIQDELEGGLQHLVPLTRLWCLSLECDADGSVEKALESMPALPQLESLELRSCGLEGVPAAVGLQTALTELDLSNNVRLLGGWERLRPLAHLQELRLGLWEEDLGQPLLERAPRLPALPALTLLSLSGQTALKEGWGNLAVLPQLRWLGLDGVHLPHMPSAFTALTALEFVQASDEQCPWRPRPDGG